MSKNYNTLMVKWYNMDKGNQYYWYRFSKIYGTDIRDTYMLVFGSDFSTGHFGIQIFAEMFCNCDVKKN